MFAIATINALATKVGSNNLGVIENTLGLFKISFGVFFNKARFSANKVALLTNMLTFSDFG